MQETPQFSEVVVSSAKINDVAASSLMNTQTVLSWLSQLVVYKPPNIFLI